MQLHCVNTYLVVVLLLVTRDKKERAVGYVHYDVYVIRV